jgi:hypothetical protein
MFHISKKKLLYLIPITVFCLVAGISLLLAKTGHFPQLAKVLRIGADTITISPSAVQVSGAKIKEVDGIYILQPDTARGGGPLYKQLEGTHILWFIFGGAGTVAGTMDAPAGSWFITDQYAIQSASPIYLYYFHYSQSKTSPVAGTCGGWSGMCCNRNDAEGGWCPNQSQFGSPAPQVTVSKVFEVDGVVKEKGTDALISGASVNIAGKTATTDANGEFKIPGIPLASENPGSPTSYPLSVSKTGYNDLISSLSSYMSGSGGIVAGGLYDIWIVYLTKNVLPPTIDQTKFNLRGQILDNSNNPISDIIIKVSCLTPATCGVGPYTATSTATLAQFQSGMGPIVKYNYEVKDIYNIDQSISSTSALSIELDNKDGTKINTYKYYKYRNVNDIWNAYNSSINLPAIDKNDHTKVQTYIYQDANENKFLAIQDYKIDIGTVTFNIFGRIKDKDNGRLLSRVKVSAYPAGVTVPFNTFSVNVLKTDPLSGGYAFNFMFKGIVANSLSFPFTLKFSRNGYQDTSIPINRVDVQANSAMTVFNVFKDIKMTSNCPIK